MDKRAITVDPATGRLMLDGQLLDRYDPRLWGRVGRNVLDVNTASGGAYGPEAYDPRYYEPYTEYDGDRGEVTRYRLRPEYADRIGNRTQLGQSGIGGYGEANDASGLVWDDEFGILADRGNINAPDDSGPQGIMANYVIPAATLAAMGYGAGSAAGLWGGAAGAAPAGAGAGAAPAGITMIDGGLPAIFEAGGAGVTMTPAALGAAAIPGGSSSGGFLSTLGSALSGGGASIGDVISSGATSLGNAITSNPGTAIRGIAGLGAAIAGSRGGGGGGGSGGGGVGDFNDLLSAQANANRVDINTPTGSRRWSQGQDGRWTVNDSMSPEEQANYENVRTMNAGATDYARQLLARTMARPQRDYFAALPPTSQYFSRWGQ